MKKGRITRFALGAAAAGLLAFAPAARADELLSESLTTESAADRDCTNRELDGGAVDAETLTTPDLGLVEAHLDGGTGDWDLAVFDAETGDTVAGSAATGPEELAQGFVAEGTDLVVQACRRSGSSDSADLSVNLVALEPVDEPLSLVNVDAPAPSDPTELQALGFDLTEHAGEGQVQIVATPDELDRLESEGYGYDVAVNDLGAQSDRQRAAEDEWADEVEESSLPSGRTGYRRLFDYSEELKALAEQNPDLVQHFTLPLQTYEGRPVEGIEITTDPRREDGKPVFLNMGVHHAREWPSGENAMEWAYELINGFKAGDPRVTNIVENTRTIIVPIVNPDGFNISREAGEIQGSGGGSTGDETTNILTSPYEYRRKNCRFADDSQGGSCLQHSAGLVEAGVDLNRNYGGFWGGPGASADPQNLTYRGPSYFSEPESENIRRLVSEHQVTTLITNHTFSALVLRPPGIAAAGNPIDEPQLKQLGDAMAFQNGYVSQHGYELYDTTGTTEDWSYYATGGLGYTFEIGCDVGTPPDNCDGYFHPPFQSMVAEYDGSSPLSQAAGGGGNRGAYFVASEATADPGLHSVLRGRAPGGMFLRLHKEFMTPTSRVLTADAREGERQFFQDVLDTVLEVPENGRYEWHMNPSTRPLVAQDQGRPANGDPSPQETFSGGPGLSAQPCQEFPPTSADCYNDHPFTVAAGPGIDNARVNVRIDWPTLVSDWDLQVFRDNNNNGISDAGDEEVGSSAQGTTDFESTTFAEPILTPGNYVVRVVNFLAAEPYEGTITFSGPDPYEAAHAESWQLSCELPKGNVLGTVPITIARGESQSQNLEDLCRVSRRDAIKACKTAPDIKGSGKKDKIKGTNGSDVIAARGGNDKVKSKGGLDIVCLGRGRDRSSAGSGDDIVVGGGGADKVKGGKGNDDLFGNRSRDILLGGPGRDTCDGGPGRDETKSCKK
jgi:murein tripeptide amidase MpaA